MVLLHGYGLGRWCLSWNLHPPQPSVDAAEGFGFLGAVVDEDGTVNHTL